MVNSRTPSSVEACVQCHSVSELHRPLPQAASVSRKGIALSFVFYRLFPTGWYSRLISHLTFPFYCSQRHRPSRRSAALCRKGISCCFTAFLLLTWPSRPVVSRTRRLSQNGSLSDFQHSLPVLSPILNSVPLCFLTSLASDMPTEMCDEKGGERSS